MARMQGVRYHRNEGVAMTAHCDLLSIPEVRRHLDTQMVGQHIYLFGTVDSTNDVMRRLALRGSGEGTVVLAEEQTAGRGRPGVRWYSPAGLNLYASVLFRPALSPRDVALFAPIASLALTEAISLEGAAADIKWPNDVVVGRRKVGGALIEYATQGERVSHVIVGIGVNLNVGRGELENALGRDADDATSVSEVSGRDVDRNGFAARFLNLLEKWHGLFVAHGPGTVLAAWQARDALRGRPIEVRAQGTAWRGRGRGVDASGCLVVEDREGHRCRIVSGAIRLLDPEREEAS
jgi:BirA family biotin operon repressor/biotin-[acetyl-CoA-carboxylase] ligase